ncbi:MAG: hypothetical protein HGA49_05690 [Eubacteriaceae bacterium]|nr:hypothetical protein [Eubacteriaceae bacterium]
MKKTMGLIILILLIVIVSGCTPIFIKEDEPVILTSAESNSSQSNASEDSSVFIKNIDSQLTDGIVYDISKDGKTLLVGTQENTALDSTTETDENFSNLNIYSFETDQLTPVLTSKQNQFSGYIDDKNKGFYYLESAPGKDSNANNKLVWTDLNGDTTKNISLNEENVSAGYSMINDELLIYGNGKGEIKLVSASSKISDEDNITSTYLLDKSYNILKVDYIEKYQMAFFLCKNEETDLKDLYYVYLTKKNVQPVLVQRNAGDFDLSTENEALIYSAPGLKDDSQLISLDIVEKTRISLYKGYLGMFAFTNTEDQIIYSEKSDPSSSSQNLWIMDIAGNDAMQLASNLNITGDRLVFHPYNSVIYFTVYALNKDENTKALNYSVYMIDYNY